MGAVEPCYPTPPSSPSRAKMAAKERCFSPTSATDLQHAHRSDRSIPASRTLATPSTGGGSVDAEPPASGRLATPLSRRCAKGGAPHRSSAALYRRFRPRTALEAQPSDASCPAVAAEDRCRRAPVKRHAAAGPRRLPSTGVPFAACASKETRHLSAALPPPDRLPTPRHLQRRPGISFRISFRLRLNDGPARASRAHRPGAGQVWRRLSISAITTVLQHKPRNDRPPRAEPRVAPRLDRCGQPCTSR